MFFLLPIGVDGATLDRRPWVSVSIAAACVVAFFITWVIPSNPGGVGEDDVRELIQETLEHPDLELPPGCTGLLSEHGKTLLRRLKAKVEVEVEAPAGDVDVEALQARLDAHCESVLEAKDSGLLQLLGLVPARGVMQWGWLTYMFLHLGWMHLLGNMLFFYVVGLLLEDAWGRPLFAGFYGVGGLVAAVAHVVLDPSSQVLMVGASGAVAACMGAFCLRFATRKVRVGYLIWFLKIWRGTFGVPGWLWAGLWFGNEVLNFVLWGNNTGVAVMAHIGGFGFGFVAASALRVTRLEERFVAPAIAAREGGWVADPRMLEAQTSLETGNREKARAAFLLILADHPDHSEALLALGRMELEDGKVPAGSARVEKALQLLVAREVPEPLWNAVDQLGELFPVERLRPGVAWRVAQGLDEGEAPANSVAMAESLYAAAGKGTGTMAVRALIRAAELRLARRDAPETAAGYLTRAKELATGDAAALAERVGQLEVEAVRMGARMKNRAMDLDTESATARTRAVAALAPVEVGGSSLPPRIIPCRILGLSDKALLVEAPGGQRRSLSVTEVLAVAVGMLPVAVPEGAAPRQTVLTDLVVSWGDPDRGPTVLRIPAAGLGLPERYPGVAPREAYARFLSALLEHSAANPMPDAPTLAEGRYPRFATEGELTAHYYGQVAAAA
ncbi:rhomboid family intramembrane serine protease [Corallococcus aberystwythensis]|uniref:Rhomboid family intramembrane serine protease n=1 Tax=Corallococcus aberystwythensis TaxID=2316722 RepID=A0A3A8PHF7_9BACT|nr:rhomboid family intramembrane serine protease [Corallococcus aberystwythensis]RKH55768.1 rhomboid family intramembrane serine protease [Corallococcus aberystwythensis]